MWSITYLKIKDFHRCPKYWKALENGAERQSYETAEMAKKPKVAEKKKIAKNAKIAQKKEITKLPKMGEN